MVRRVFQQSKIQSWQNFILLALQPSLIQILQANANEASSAVP